MASHDPLSLEKIHDIPDPAARLSSKAVHDGGDPRALAAGAPEAAPPAERSPTRAERRTRARAAVVAAVAWVVAALAIFGIRPDIASPAAAAPLAAWVLGGAVALGLLLRPRARGLPAGVRAVQHALWMVPAVYVVVALIVAAPAEAPLTWQSVRGCLCIAGAMALGPLVAGALLLRGAFLSAPGWRGAAVGGLLGLAGSAGVHAHCSDRSLGHVLAAHGAAIAIAAAAGGALGRAGGRP
jgi:hypothetical protein